MRHSGFLSSSELVLQPFWRPAEWVATSHKSGGKILHKQIYFEWYHISKFTFDPFITSHFIISYNFGQTCTTIFLLPRASLSTMIYNSMRIRGPQGGVQISKKLCSTLLRNWGFILLLQSQKEGFWRKACLNQFGRYHIGLLRCNAN